MSAAKLALIASVLLLAESSQACVQESPSAFPGAEVFGAHATWDGRMSIPRTTCATIGQRTIGSPKSGDQRSVPLSSRVRALLEKLPRRGRWVFAARRSKQFPKGDHQFSDRHLLRALKRVLKKLGLPGHVHTFRHAFISHALTRGTPEAIVRRWVGHVDAEIMRL